MIPCYPVGLYEALLLNKVASKVTSCGSRRVTADLQELLGHISAKELGRIFLKQIFLNVLDPS